MAKQGESKQPEIEEELCEPWKAEPQRQFLIDRVKRKKAEGELPLDAKVNDKLLAKEHLKFWLAVAIEEKIPRLLTHPLLTKQDKQRIDKVLEKYKKQQMIVGACLTLGTSALYWMFLSRRDTFYRFFNKKNSYPAVNFVKKSVALYLVWISWMLVLNSHYEKAIPNELH